MSVAIELPETFPKLQLLEESAVAYIAGYITKAKLKIHNCQVCKHNILKRPEEDDYDFLEFIKVKELGGARTHRLKYINKDFFKILVQVYNITSYIINNHFFIRGLLSRIKQTLKENIAFNFHVCEHSEEVTEKILDSFCKLLIHTFSNGITNIILGKATKLRNESKLHLQAKCVHNKRHQAKGHEK